jgi:hypothetical protein
VRDYLNAQPPAQREAYELWQQLARDVGDGRHARRWEQSGDAGAAGITLNTELCIEHGKRSLRNLFEIRPIMAPMSTQSSRHTGRR